MYMYYPLHFPFLFFPVCFLRWYRREVLRNLFLNENAHVSHLPRVDGVERFPYKFYLDPMTLTYDIDPCDLWPWPLWPWPSWPWPLTTLSDTGIFNSEVKTRFWALDLDLWPWPTTLTYNLNLDKVKVDLHTINQGRRSKGSAVRGRTDGWTDGRYQVQIISLFRQATQSITKGSGI